jgi:uncharacterized protein
MNTRPEERLAFLDLARQGARVERRLAPEDLPRLSSIAHVLEPVRMALDFALDDLGRGRVSGWVEARLRATCQRCLEDVERTVSVQLNLLIVSEGEARQLGGETDLRTVEGSTVTCAELVEDELILALPERLCLEEPCPRMPTLYYPAAEADEPPQGAGDGSSNSKENPFNVLAALKDQADS